MSNNDSYLRAILTIIAIMLFVLVVAIMNDSPSILPTAQAQGIPDAGAQRNQIIQELQQVQEQLTRLNATLQSGNVKVQIYTPPQPNDRPGR